MKRSHKIFRMYERVTGFSILHLSSYFVRKSEFNKILSIEINSFYDILVMSFVKDPGKENYLKKYLPPIYTPIMIGKLAGKVRYPVLSTFYKDCT